MWFELALVRSMKILFVLVCFFGFYAASEPELSTEVKSKWKFKTSLGLNLGYTFNQTFIGLQNGQAFSPGFQLDEVVHLHAMPHSWRTEFSLSEAWTLTTPQTVFVKSSDSLYLKTHYLYHVLKWFGPHVAAKVRTSIFPGEDVEALSTTYTITDAKTGVKTTDTSTGSDGTYKFSLTSPFMPLILEQDVGVFFQPYHREELELELRTAATMRESLGKGQRILTAHGVVYNNTPVRQLDNVYELGPSVTLHLKGELFEKKLSYRFTCDVLWSFLQTPVASFHSTNRLSYDLSTGIGFNLLPWLALHWQFKAILNPAVLDQTQLMSNLILSVHYFSK